MSSISAGTSAGSALVSTGDSTGDLILQVNGTTPSVSLKANGAIGLGSGSSYGTAGQALLSGGSGAAPSWGSAGAMSLVSTLTPGGATSVAWTGLSGSSIYWLVINAIRVSSNGDFIQVRLGTGAGPTYTTSAYYNYMTGSSNVTGNAAGYANNSDTDSFRLGWPLGLGNGYTSSAQILLCGLTTGPNVSYTATFGGWSGTYNLPTTGVVGGVNYTLNPSSTPVTAIQVSTPSGNLGTVGSMSLFKINT